ncbi:MAG TPA: protein kinase [Steroidobacteraceae bacterium]|nr:protein kinase [Steroidobacteraceae bacterium]
MIDERRERIKDLLHHAMQLAVEERSRFLDETCASDPGMRLEIESLLCADADAPPGFLRSSGSARLATDARAHEAPVAGLEAGQLFEERYVLIRKLGEGGMGQVWLAEQIAPVERQVALKLIKAGMYDATVLQRFLAERQSLAIMDHPCIAKVFDAGTTALGQPYFVMEFVPGVPITEYCDRRKLGISERLELFIRACEGVQHAHQKAVIHRDLKPANILVVELDGQPMPRIIDFGLAKPAAPAEGDTVYTQLGHFLGTPGYMSPEQVAPSLYDIDTRTDVYSLGVILCVLLTGLQPFETRRGERPPVYELLRKIREEDPPPLTTKVSADRDSAIMVAFARSTDPKQLVRRLRGDLEWITMKALERDRERRYATPLELAQDLRRSLNYEPIVARPANAAYQLRRFIRRHRIAAAVTGVVVVLAIVTSGAGLIAVRKEREAQSQRHEAEMRTRQALDAQAHLLTEVAAQRLRDFDVAGARAIILDVLTNPKFLHARSPDAISVFQDVRAADRELALLSGHRERVFDAAYSPDGERIVTASADKTARVWDARTAAQLAVLTGHTDRIFAAAYSPDGRRIVTASRDRTARVWDAQTGAQLLVLPGHGDRVSFAAFSPDGERIVTASWDRVARVWDAHSGALLTSLVGHSDVLYSAGYSPDGARIVTASQDKTARIWDARTGAALAVLAGHGDYVASAAYSPDGARIVTASADRTARIWDARSGAALGVLAGHSEVVYSAAYSPDGGRIVTASWDRTARIWDAHTAAQLAVLSGHAATVASAEYSPDGERIVTASQDGTARIWNAHIGAQLAVLAGHAEGVYSATYSPDGERIVTASEDATARIWSARTGAPLTVLTGHRGAVSFAVFSPDGERIVTASQDKTARIWDARSGVELATLTGHADRLYCAAYSPDGERIVTASRDKTARIWDARSGAELAVLSGHNDRVYFAAYSPDGRRIVTASRDKTARIWDARSGEPLEVLAGHLDEILTAAYSPDGLHVVTASLDDTVRIWDQRTGKELAVLSGNGDRAVSAAYSPDGTRLVTTSADRVARIWDAHSGAELAALVGHGGDVEFGAYSPDGVHLVTAALDKTARIWNAQVPGDIDAQILWSAAAEPDAPPTLGGAEQAVSSNPGMQRAPTRGSACDQSAAAFYDPDRAARGTLLEALAVDAASAACEAEIDRPRHAARSDYQMGRALFAKGDLQSARRWLEIAVSRDYRAARIDLADLLLKSSDKADRDQAATLYRSAWQQGVPIAAYKLGQLYEYASTSAASDPDSGHSASEAWAWYQRGADAREPNALARFAERDELRALAESDAKARAMRLLQAFSRYAAAVESARLQNWPDEACRLWRHRRASLARVLGQEGLLVEVARAYRAALAAPRS